MDALPSKISTRQIKDRVPITFSWLSRRPAIASSRANQKALAILADDPLGRFAAPAPCISRFGILVFRRQRRLLGRAPALGGDGKAKILSGQTVFSDLLADVSDHVVNFSTPRFFCLCLQFSDLRLEVCILRHSGSPLF
ncbi:protein of unknown function [Paraburkholderia dioscoreae]|uniref:Uncharacterized protein n=1 Tax=Paraburkholderia dioscoreae TaxID=2604047 RepID=A0A5Q4ZK99_9BURK|nr:protein of unknown function [Paraburkholderia dioscoreae]